MKIAITVLTALLVAPILRTVLLRGRPAPQRVRYPRLHVKRLDRELPPVRFCRTRRLNG